MADQKNNRPLSDKKEASEAQNYKKAYLVTIGIMVLILIIILVIGISRAQTRKQEQAISNPNVSRSVTDSSENEEQRTTTNPVTVPVKTAKNGIYMNSNDPEMNGAVDGAVYTIIPSISKKPNYYYFCMGKFDPTYTGLIQDGLNSDIHGYPAEYYYMKNGVFQKNFRGLVARSNYMRVVIHGREQLHYNGDIRIGPKARDIRWKWPVQNGAVLQYETGRLDNYVDPTTDWELLN